MGLKKRLALRIVPVALACLLAYSTTAHGQNTISDTGEFRIDGESFSFTLMGTTIVVNPPLDPVDPNAPARAAEETLAVGMFDSSTLTIGPHLLEVGFDSDDGATVRMGPFIPQWFFVTGTKQITGAEWYIDTDPGVGSATPVSLPNDGAWGDTEESITLTLNGLVSSGLSVGPHTLFIRSKDQDNLWSPASPAPFEVAPPHHHRRRGMGG